MNAAWIGFDTDQRDPNGGATPLFFTVVEYTFCVLFSLELCVRFMSYKRRLMFFKDPIQWYWNIFDTFLVSMVVIENTVIPLLLNDSEGLRSLSTMRLLRLLRISRVLRMVPELAMMVKSMLAAIRSVSMTFLLATGIMYVFSIVLTQWAQGHKQKSECEDFTCVDEAFGTIAKSLLSLTQILVFDDTFPMIRAILDESAIYGCLLLFFIGVASFTVLNMLIGVICEIVSTTTAMESEKGRRIQVVDLFEQIDVDGSGTLTRAEFQNFNAAELLEKLGIDDIVLKHAFDIMDVDGHPMLMAEFIEMIFKLLHPPEAQDVLVIHRKLERLAAALGVTGSEKRKPRKRSRSKCEDSDATTPREGRSAILPAECEVIERKIDELELQIASMTASMPVDGRSAAVPATAVVPDHEAWGARADELLSPQLGVFEKELLSLDGVIARLRDRLELSGDHLSNSNARDGEQHGGAFGEAAGLVHWQRICGEVAQSLGGASDLVAQLLVNPELEDARNESKNHRSAPTAREQLQSPISGAMSALPSVGRNTASFASPTADRRQTR